MRKLSNYLVSQSFLFLRIFNYNFVVFTYAATASKITDLVTKLVMHTVFNTNL